MGKPKQPLELAKLKGATKKDPQRYRKEPPKSNYELGDPPKRFNKELKAIWHEVVRYSLPGVLTGAERFTMEILCDLIYEYRNPPSYGFTSAKLSQLTRILGLFGMNPVDRQRLGVEAPKGKKGKPDDDFSDFD